MADTVYENEQNGVSATRFWGGKDKDCVQITFHDLARSNGYAAMNLVEFHKMAQAIFQNVEETKDAWWHKLANKS